MGAYDDYINSLDGQENLDVTEVVANLSRLHTEELEPLSSKIATQNQAIQSAQNDIAARDAEITRWKAKNWDLANSAPADESTTEIKRDAETGLPDGSRITLDDMFK